MTGSYRQAVLTYRGTIHPGSYPATSQIPCHWPTAHHCLLMDRDSKLAVCSNALLAHALFSIPRDRPADLLNQSPVSKVLLGCKCSMCLPPWRRFVIQQLCCCYNAQYEGASKLVPGLVSVWRGFLPKRLVLISLELLRISV